MTGSPEAHEGPFELDALLRSDQELDALAADHRADGGDPALRALGALARDADNEPVRAHPPAALEPRRHPRRGGRTMVAAGATAALLVVLGTLVAWGGLLDPVARMIGISHRSATSEIEVHRALDHARDALDGGRTDAAERYLEQARERWRRLSDKPGGLAERILALEQRLAALAGEGMAEAEASKEPGNGHDVPSPGAGRAGPPDGVPVRATDAPGSGAGQGNGAGPPQRPADSADSADSAGAGSAGSAGGNAPGGSGEAPGRSGEAPGRSGEVPAGAGHR